MIHIIYLWFFIVNSLQDRSMVHFSTHMCDILILPTWSHSYHSYIAMCYEIFLHCCLSIVFHHGHITMFSIPIYGYLPISHFCPIGWICPIGQDFWKNSYVCRRKKETTITFFEASALVEQLCRHYPNEENISGRKIIKNIVCRGIYNERSE